MDSDTWRNYSKEELEKQYSPSQWHPHRSAQATIERHVELVEKESAASYERVSCQRNIRYGPSEREVMDIFAEDILPPDAPIFCFIHGGFWQMMSHHQYALDAEPLSRAGLSLCLLEYQLAPHASLPQIVSQVKQGLRFLLRRAKQRGCRGVYLAGHSAGGHLVSMALADSEIMQSKLIRGAICVSSVFELEPIVNTRVNDPLQMTVELARELSPRSLVEDIAANCADVPVVVLVGQFDSPEFIRQSKEFCQDLVSRKVPASMVLAEGVDHFDVLWTIPSTLATMMGRSQL